MRNPVAGLDRLPHHAYRSDHFIAGGCVIVSACDQLRLVCIPSPCIICYIFTAAGHEGHHFCSWMGRTSYVKPSIIHINSVRKSMQCHFINLCIYHWKTIVLGMILTNANMSGMTSNMIHAHMVLI